jgi:serine/threonine protein kinase
MERYVYQEDLVGAGGFGKVRVAHDTTLDRSVAIKTLDPILKAFSEKEQERFKREARTLAKLSHPNNPAVYEVEFTKGSFNIFFQYIEGQNLRTTIDKNGPTQIGVAKNWFYQIASALEHAHKLGIIHRDIKPENIVITPDQQTAYLVDFGIALSAEEAKRLTETGYVVGTRGYMSPEQLAGEALDLRTDIYSLGVTLYEVLAGKRMPVGGYEDLSANEAIPPAIDDLIEDCLLPKERRLGSARLFGNRLLTSLSQPSRPLSDVLVHGKLHELASVIEELTASEFMALPPGQRILTLSKISDVVTSKDRNLSYAGEHFLQLLLTRGILLPKDDYREIVSPAIQWAFEMRFDSSVGRESLRKGLEEAAFIARDGAYDVITEEILAYLHEVDLSVKEDWYLHTVRDVVEALMANQECSTGASQLGTVFRSINRVQRGKPGRSWAPTQQL